MSDEMTEQSLSAIVSLLRTVGRMMRERDDALDELHQERIGRQQAADELMRLKDHDHSTVAERPANARDELRERIEALAHAYERRCDAIAISYQDPEARDRATAGGRRMVRDLRNALKDADEETR